MFGEAGRGSGEDGAGGAVAERLQRQSASSNQVAFELWEFELGCPVLPETLGVLAAIKLGSSIGPEGAGTATELED